MKFILLITLMKNLIQNLLSYYFRQFDIRESHNCSQDEKICLIDLQNHIGAGTLIKWLSASLPLTR